MKYKLLLTLVIIIYSGTAISAESLVVFSGRSDKFVKPVLEAFTKDTGIEVTLHAGKSTALLNKLRVEGERTEADIFFSNDAGTLQKGSELELFSTIPDSNLSVIPKNFRAQDNTWVGLSARARVLVANTNNEAAKNVKSVFDLANSKFNKRLAITNSTNESFIAGVTVYMLASDKTKVSQWLQGMKSNVNGKVFNKHSKIVKAVASGKKDIGLVNHYYIYRHLAKHPDAPITIILPDQNSIGVAWNVAGAAVSKYSKKQKLALQLIDFLVSQKGQQQFAEVNREYPTRKGVPASSEVPALDSFKVADVPMYKLGTERNATIDLLESIGMP